MEDPPLKKIRQISGDDEDRLSSLPDCVLCYILSFLETKCVIQTSVLSKRFQNLWSSLPSLNLQSSCFRCSQYFDKFVDRVLTLRDISVRVESFQLYHRGTIPDYLLQKIINYAMSHGVLRLDIEVTPRRSYSFPESAYSSESLRTFELKIRTELKKPLSFPNLKKLHLAFVSLTHSDFLSTCPCLTELTLISCFWPTLKINSPTLTKLTIRSATGDSFECKVMVSAPKLASFCYSGYDWQQLSILSEPSDLEVVSLELWCHRVEKEEKLQSNLIKWLQPFHNAKYITLSLQAIKVLLKFPDLLPKSSPFPNMKSFSVKAWIRECSLVIPAQVTTYLLGDPPRAEPTLHERYPFCGKCFGSDDCKPVWQRQRMEELK